MDLQNKIKDFERRKKNFYAELVEMTIKASDPNVNYRNSVSEGMFGFPRCHDHYEIINEIFGKHFGNI